MKIYKYKDALFSIDINKNNLHYLCKCQYGFDILKETYIGYNLAEVKRKFIHNINYHFFMDDYQRENTTIN